VSPRHSTADVAARQAHCPASGRHPPGRLTTSASVLAIANSVAGGLNYLFGLTLSYVLTPSEYVVAAAGNSLLLIVGTVAMSSGSWALAHRLAAAPTDRHDQHAVISAGLVLAGAQGFTLAAACIAVSLRFSSPIEIATIAASAVLASVGVVAKGITQGLGRFGLLSLIVIGEVAIKIVAGLVLIHVGAGAAGALAGTAVGAITLCLIAVSWVMPHGFSVNRVVLRAMWRTSVGMIAIQGFVAMITAVDFLVVADLPGSAKDAAAYQLASVIGKSPAFLAAAVAAVFFPVIARHPSSSELRTASVSLMLQLVLPAGIILMTIPTVVLTWFLPAGYAGVESYLPLTGGAGLLFASITLVASWLCATERYTQGATAMAIGAVADLAAVLIGAENLDVRGVAVGSLAGAATVLTLLLIAQGERPIPQPRSLVVSILIAMPLIAARTAPPVWLALAVSAAAATAIISLRGASSTGEEAMTR